MTAPRRAARGFSLLEVMIVLGILGLISGMTIGVFRQIDTARATTADQGDRYAGARLALTRLSRELSMAFISDHFDMRLRERPTAFIGREDGVLFTTFAHERLMADARESDQAVVQYTLESLPQQESGQGQGLFRREKIRLDEDLERGGRKDLVAEHVLSIRFRYWDPQKKDWVREWSTRSIDRTNALPSRIRIDLELALAGGKVEKLSTETRVALTRPLDF
ncbi:MAG: type II secretion system protein GspJ [Anaeromyxobacter sp.]